MLVWWSTDCSHPQRKEHGPFHFLAPLCSSDVVLDSSFLQEISTLFSMRFFRVYAAPQVLNNSLLFLLSVFQAAKFCPCLSILCHVLTQYTDNLMFCLCIWLVGWLVDWLVAWLLGCLLSWLLSWLLGWMGGWLIGCMINDWLAGSLVGWLVGCSVGCRSVG